MDILTILKEVEPEKGKTVKDSTLESYAKTLERLKKKCDGDSLYKFLNKPKETLKCISDNPNSIKTTIVPILMFLKLKDADESIIDAYKEIQDKAIEDINEHYKSGEKSEKQKQNWLSVEELKDILLKEEDDYETVRAKVRGQLKPNTYLDTQQYILLKLHLDYPIRNDLAETEIIPVSQFNKFSPAKQRAGNFLVINKNSAKLVLNEYKTEKHYGKKEIELNDDITEALNEWIIWRKKHGYGSNYLFINKYKNALNSNGITKAFMRLFRVYDKQISTSMIRHIILTEKFGEVNKEKEEMADVMGNSTKTIDEKYVKKNDD